MTPAATYAQAILKPAPGGGTRHRLLDLTRRFIFGVALFSACSAQAQDAAMESKALKAWRKEVVGYVAAVHAISSARAMMPVAPQALAGLLASRTQDAMLAQSPIVTLEMDKTGRVTAVGNVILIGEEEIRAFLTQELALRSAEAKQSNGFAPTPILILRSDRNARYRDVHRFLEIATQVGFLRWQVLLTREK
jgi:biopolymer transport protein ExbD